MPFPKSSRRGSVLPLVVISLVALFGFVALAVDLGVMAIARTQAQNAADSAAMAGARRLNGDSAVGTNLDLAAQTAINAAAVNKIMTASVKGGTAGKSGSNSYTAGQVKIEFGSYTYNTTSTKFEPKLPRDTNDNWTLAKSTVTYDGQTSGFARVLGQTAFSTGATATAVHRPRDIALVLDFSGSMRFGSLFGLPYSGARAASGFTPNSGSNNPESVVPTFGHYSDTSGAGLQRTSQATLGGITYKLSNATESNTYNNNRQPVILDFYQHASGTTPQVAWTSAGDGDTTGFVSGDKPWKQNTNQSNTSSWSTYSAGSSWASTVRNLLGLTSGTSTTTKIAAFEDVGYDHANLKTANGGNAFKGYTQGPRYYGKTFFIWPPDPRAPVGQPGDSTFKPGDWRQRFFFQSNGTTAVSDNSLLWDSSGNWRLPTSSGTTYYKINYQAIFKWLQASPSPFPARLRAGRILYYSALPNASDSGLNNRFWNTFPLTDQNERFWKDYVDYVLGLQQTGSSTWVNIVNKTGYGDDFAMGTPSINPNPGTGSSNAYMDYRDNPERPRLRLWFGPLTMVDFMGNYNLWSDYRTYCWWPGTCHEAPLYACKLGIRGSLDDMKANHPNDQVSLIMFSHPMESATDTSGGGRFNRVRAPMGRNYSRMVDALWYPAYTLDNPGQEIRPYDFSNNLETPRAMGGTCYSMGLMLAYNQFSSNTTLRTFNPSPAPAGDAGGLGRRGATKLVIFETDGQPSHTASASLNNGGAGNSYYMIRYNSTTVGSSEFPSVTSYSTGTATVNNEANALCTQLCALETASPPGYSTARKKVTFHTLAFGAFVEPGSPDRDSALSLLAGLEAIGNVPAADRITSADAAYKVIVGSDSEMVSKLQTAITKIMQDGVQVSMIE